MTPSETTKKSPMRVAPGICVQEVNMNAVGLAGWRLVDDGGVGVIGDDGHGGPPLGWGMEGYLLLLMYSTML